MLLHCASQPGPARAHPARNNNMACACKAARTCECSGDEALSPVHSHQSATCTGDKAASSTHCIWTGQCPVIKAPKVHAELTERRVRRCTRRSAAWMATPPSTGWTAPWTVRPSVSLQRGCACVLAPAAPCTACGQAAAQNKISTAQHNTAWQRVIESCPHWAVHDVQASGSPALNSAAQNWTLLSVAPLLTVCGLQRSASCGTAKLTETGTSTRAWCQTRCVPRPGPGEPPHHYLACIPAVPRCLAQQGAGLRQVWGTTEVQAARMGWQAMERLAAVLNPCCYLLCGFCKSPCSNSAEPAPGAECWPLGSCFAVQARILAFGGEGDAEPRPNMVPASGWWFVRSELLSVEVRRSLPFSFQAHKHASGPVPCASTNPWLARASHYTAPCAQRL